MKSIVIVDCKSTGLNFIEDIINRGYNPVVLELKAPTGSPEEYKKAMEN